MLGRPERSECAEYYFTYIDRVPEGNVLDVLGKQLRATSEFLHGLPNDALHYRYAPDKWSVKEVIGHLIDTERMFSFRAFSFARGEPAALPSFEQDPYIEQSRYHERPIEDIVEEYESVRGASIVLFKSINDDEWMRRGIASDVEFTVRTVPYIIAGHEIHHRGVIDERYLKGRMAVGR